MPTTGDSGMFVVMPDLPKPGVACDPWQDMCPAGQKCKPYSFGLELGYSEASCVPIADPSTPTGAACEAPMSSYTDECERGATCHGFYLPPESLRCHPLCTGSAADPMCADSCSRCIALIGEGIAGVCFLTCDPRASDCPEGQACVALVDSPQFLCSPGPGLGAAGESCAGVDACAEGMACVDSTLVPGCMGDKCCAPVCDLGGADTCAAALPGTACAPWPVSGPDFDAACLPAGLGLCAAV